MRKTVFEKSSNGRDYELKCPNGAYTMGRPCEWLSRKLALFKAQPQGSQGGGTAPFLFSTISIFCGETNARNGF